MRGGCHEGSAKTSALICEQPYDTFEVPLNATKSRLFYLRRTDANGSQSRDEDDDADSVAAATRLSL